MWDKTYDFFDYKVVPCLMVVALTGVTATIIGLGVMVWAIALGYVSCT